MDKSNEDKYSFASRQEFSRDVATAILEKEEENKALKSYPTKTNPITLLKETYTALCYDDPIVSSTNDTLSKLANILIESHGFGDDTPSSSSSSIQSVSGAAAPTFHRTQKAGEEPRDSAAKFALCDRFVEGILQATSRTTATNTTSGHPTNTNHENADADNNLQLNNNDDDDDGATIEGYAELTFTIFARGPLCMIQSGNELSKIQSFLGSYSGHHRNTPPRRDNATEEEDKKDDSEDDRDDDSLKEIFAEEEDPDDFQYESSYDPNADALRAASQLEVRQVFQPMTNVQPLTWDQARHRALSLLQQLNYARNMLSFIPTKRWNEMEASKIVQDLVLALLPERTTIDWNYDSILSSTRDGTQISSLDSSDQNDKQSEATSRSNEEPSTHPHDLQMEFIRVIFVLRDRSVDPRNHHDSLSDLFHLLRQLFQLSSHAKEGFGDTDKACGLTPSESVALLCLSSLCSSEDLRKSMKAKSQLDTFVSSFLENMASLTEIIRMKFIKITTEKPNISHSSSPDITEEKEENDVSAPKREDVVAWEQIGCLATIFQYLPTVKEIESTLLSSGLFREMILLYTSTASTTVSTSSPVEIPTTGTTLQDGTRKQLLRSIYAICASSKSNDLCGYISRVTEFVTELKSDTLLSENNNNTADGLLWAILLSENVPNVGRLRVVSKKKHTSPSQLSEETKSFDTLFREGFINLCRHVKEALIRFQKQQEKTQTKVTDAKEEEMDSSTTTTTTPMKHFISFTNSLISYPKVCNAFSTTLFADTEFKEKVDQCMTDLKQALSKTSCQNVDASAKIHSAKNDDDDDDNQKKSREQLRSFPQDDVVVLPLRKSVKFFSSLLLEGGGGGSVASSISSKAD